MSIIEKLSVRYIVLKGEYKGRLCSPRKQDNDPPGKIFVIFLDCIHDEFAILKIGYLSSTATPGWAEESHRSPYNLEEYSANHRGLGSNLLRTPLYVQPGAMRPGDELATGEIVLDYPRGGFNSSSIIPLDRSGWVEMASRPPIALMGNENFKLPCDLKKGDKFVTTCKVAKDSSSERVNWTRIWLDHSEDGFEVPSCIPLALA